MLERYIPNLGSTDDLEDIVRRHDIEEVVIALESNEHNRIKGIVDKLYNTNVAIKAIPDMYDILTGKVRMTAIFGIPLIEINRNIMPLWQVVVKRLLDILLSLVAMILLLPLCLIIGVGVKLSSHGPIFYKQERIGKNGVPFKIYKFRSMFADAEKDGPALSCKDDVRVTHFGRFLRKSRLDEIPNFINVLKGEMSLVGPRPERRYYIDKIVAKAPHYMHLLSVRPGITSWGQVKYGYAENVEQMIQRLKYDLIYIENRSLFVDVKIMIYTIKIIFQGKGL